MIILSIYIYIIIDIAVVFWLIKPYANEKMMYSFFIIENQRYKKGIALIRPRCQGGDDSITTSHYIESKYR